MKKEKFKFENVIILFNVTVLLVFLFATEIFAEASIIYAPTQAPVVVENTVKAVEESITPESEVISYLVEDINSVDYVRLYNVYQDDYGNVYCRNNGNNVKNAWRKINISSFAEFAPVENFTNGYIWAYFNQAGKAIKATSGKIKKTKIGNNTYAFNEYGQMLEGYFNDEGEVWNGGDGDPFDLIDSNKYIYYADMNTGILTAGWHKYIYGSEKYEDKDNIWMYFNPSNYRCVRSTNNNYKSMNIDGKTYAFDNNGVMLVGFEAMQYNYDNGGNTSKITYFSKDGKIIKDGFVDVDLNSDLNSEIYKDADEDITIYLNKSGVMYKDTIKKIESFYYGFDEKGVVVKGLSVWKDGKFVSNIETLDTVGKSFIVNGNYKDKKGTSHVLGNNEDIYYFDENGRRRDSGILEFADENYTFKAVSNKGYSGLYDKKFYTNGLLMKPMNDTKYGIYILNPVSTTYSFSQVAGNSNAYVVNNSGLKQTSVQGIKDENDYYWLLNSSGNLINIYNVQVKYSSGKYYFRSENDKGNTAWILFGEKDQHGKTCVAQVCENGTKLSNGAISAYQVKPSREVALNFYLQ